MWTEQSRTPNSTTWYNWQPWLDGGLNKPSCWHEIRNREDVVSRTKQISNYCLPEVGDHSGVCNRWIHDGSYNGRRGLGLVTLEGCLIAYTTKLTRCADNFAPQTPQTDSQSCPGGHPCSFLTSELWRPVPYRNYEINFQFEGGRWRILITIRQHLYLCMIRLLS